MPLLKKKKLTAQHCARNLAVSRPQKVWGLTFAGTWGEGRHPQVSFSALHLTFLKLETWFSLYSCFSIFSQRPLKISSFCGIWVWRYDLVLQVMSCPKWRIPNILRWLWALWAFDTLISAFFCQSYLPPIIEHVVLRCTDVRVRVKVNLGHLKLLRFRQVEFTFREVSLNACLVKASQFMISCRNRQGHTNRSVHTSVHTQTYTLHRHTNTYHWPWPNLTWNDHSQQISRIVWQRAVLARLALIRQRHRYMMGWPAACVGILFDITTIFSYKILSLAVKSNRFFGKWRIQWYQFYLIRSVIDLPGQVKLKNVAVWGHRCPLEYHVRCSSCTDDAAVLWCQAS